MRIKNLPSILSMDGSQDALVIEQTDGSEDKSRKVSPAQIKQYVLGNSIDDIYSVMGQNGAKNLIPYPYYEKTHTDNGITWTDNGDGTVTANGTATATSIFSMVLGNTALSDNGNLTINTNKPLILSGCPSGGGNNTYRIQYGLTDGTSYWAKTASDTGSGVELTPVDGLNSYCFDVIRVMVFEGYTANNLTFKPMLRLASDTDNTYQPYAKTNRQLTEAIGDLSQTGLTGDSVAEQLGDASGQIGSLKTPTLIWEGSATVVDNIYNMTGNCTDYKYLLVVAKTNIEEKNILIPTSRISSNTIFSDVLSAGAWNSNTNAFTYNSCYGIKFTAANKFQLAGLTYNNSNWILKPVKIYGIG